MIQHSATTVNLAGIIERHARIRPNKTAIVAGEARLTYRQLNMAANRVANGLKKSGYGPGDNIALVCPNRELFPVLLFGILKTGACAVPLNFLFRANEFAYHLADSEARAVFTFEGASTDFALAKTVKAGFDEVSTCENLIVMTADESAESPIADAQTFAEFIANESEEFESHPTAPDDSAVILYTSGTTGQPKGAELTHLNLLLNAIFTREASLPAFTEVELFGATGMNQLITLPLFHSTGLTAQMLANLYGGGCCVLLPRFEPQAVLEVMRREKISSWTGVPTMYWALLKFIKENNWDASEIGKHLRLVSSGGAPMPVELMLEIKKTFAGVNVSEGYGLSETSPVATFNHIELAHKPGTVGQSLLACDVRCVGETGEPVATGTRGEVVIRGHNIMKGYYNRPEATAESIRDGWFYTGDVGVMDEDGYLSIVDRTKDLILRGGFNVYPRELEEVLMTHEAVSLCAVIGVPDEKFGEEVKACVVLKTGAELTCSELRDWCKQRVAANKYPRIIEFYENLPLNATGKILKRELREMEIGKAKTAAQNGKELF
jgi:long-chain acyl-CoA synthetase